MERKRFSTKIKTSSAYAMSISCSVTMALIEPIFKEKFHLFVKLIGKVSNTILTYSGYIPFNRNNPYNVRQKFSNYRNIPWYGTKCYLFKYNFKCKWTNSFFYFGTYILNRSLHFIPKAFYTSCPNVISFIGDTTHVTAYTQINCNWQYYFLLKCHNPSAIDDVSSLDCSTI